MRFLHTSDWHIGRQFHNVSLLDDQRHVLTQISRVAADRQIDALIVAGDIYDRSVPSAAAVDLLDDTLNHLCNDLQVPVILIAGNHDGPERLAFGARQLAGAGLHVVGPLWKSPQPVVIEGRHGEVAFYPIPYADPATVRQVHGAECMTHDEAMAYLLAQVRKDNGSERPCVVIAHCFLAGGEVSESERPLSIGGADQVSADYFKNFSYAALGHLHGPQYRGAQHVRYAGSPMKYSFSEQRQRKSVTLVELDSAGQASFEQIPLQPLRDMRVVEGTLDELLAAGQTDPHREDYLLVRLSDTHAILDVMNKLRQVYPNVLHLERPGLMSRSERLEASRERLKKGERMMFEDFFKQVTGDALSLDQEKVINETLDALYQNDEA